MEGAVFPLQFACHFEPTEEELLDFLTDKAFYGDDSVPSYLPIIRRDIYADEAPAQIFSGSLADAEEVYAFTPLKNKFEKGKGKEIRDRTVGGDGGHWHGQRTTPILNSSEDLLLGFRTTLNFFHDHRRATKSAWIMQEYTLPYPGVNWALCRIYRTPRDYSDTPAPADKVVGKVKRKLDHHDDPEQRNQRTRPLPDDIPLPHTLEDDDYCHGDVTMAVDEMMALFGGSLAPTDVVTDDLTQLAGLVPVPPQGSDESTFDPCAFFDGVQEEFQKFLD